MVRLRWGIVGCGWVATDYAAPAIAASANGVLVAVHDPDPAAMARLGGGPACGATARCDTARCDTLAALLGRGDLDAVYVATPNHAHRPVVEAAAQAGIAVLCEKPMAPDAADAAAMLRACRAGGVPYATAFDQRFHAAHQMLAAMIADGALGRVSAIRIVYACWVDAGWSPDNWRIDRARAGGGALIDLAPHGLDLAAMLLGEPLTDIAALGQARIQSYPDPALEDGAMLVARSRSGVLVQLHVAYNCPETLPRRRLEVVGTRAMAVLTDTMGQVPGGRFVLIDAADGQERPVDVPGLHRSPFLAQMEAFAACVLAGRPFAFTGEADLALMTLVEQAQRAARPPKLAFA